MKLNLSSSVSLAAVAGLSGCMVGPNYTPPVVKLNPSFTQTAAAPTTRVSTVATNAAPPTEWWTTFRDTELESLIQRAAKQNLNLKEAASRVRQARAQRGVTGSDLLPKANLDGGYQRAHGSNNVSIPLGAFGASSGSKAAATPSKGKLTLPNKVTPAINEAAHPGGPQSPFGTRSSPRSMASRTCSASRANGPRRWTEACGPPSASRIGAAEPTTRTSSVSGTAIRGNGTASRM